MIKNLLFTLFCYFALVVPCLAGLGEPEDKKEVLSKEEASQTIEKFFGGNGFVFSKNNGQWKEEGLIYRTANGMSSIGFFNDNIVYSLRKVEEIKPKFDADGVPINEGPKVQSCAWRLQFLNANKDAEIVGSEEVKRNINYFRGNSTAAKKLKEYKTIEYKGLYEGVNLKYYNTAEGYLKYDFIVDAGADAAQIGFSYTGAQSVKVNKDGQLEIKTPWGIFKQDKPYSYQIINGKEVEVASKFVLRRGEVRFELGDYSTDHQLVIDPMEVDWSTYFYGRGYRYNNNQYTYSYTYVRDVDIDNEYNIYVTGFTLDDFDYSPNAFDTINSMYNNYGWGYDAFIAKLTPEGDSLTGFSYLGGNYYEWATSLIVNHQKEPVIAGFIWGTYAQNLNVDFPLTKNALDTNRNSGAWVKSYVTKFGKDLDTLVYSTLFGGSGTSRINQMELNNKGDVYIVGGTTSGDLLVTSNAYQSTIKSAPSTYYHADQDGFFSVISADGSSLIYSTYLGGKKHDEALDLFLNEDQEVYIVGKTAGDFAVTPGSPAFNKQVKGDYDGYIIKFKSSLNTVEFANLMGGTGSDQFESVYVSAIGDVYIGGISNSTNFPTTPGTLQPKNAGGYDFVIVKMLPSGKSFRYSTYLGGSGNDGEISQYYNFYFGNSNIRVSANIREEFIVAGVTKSDDFPITPDHLQDNKNKPNNWWWQYTAVVGKINWSGTKLLYGTYYGGSSWEYVGAVRVKKVSCVTNILLGGFTSSQDYPTTKGSYRDTFKTFNNQSWSGYNGFVTKFTDTLVNDPVALGPDRVYCDKVFNVLDAKNQGAEFVWSTGDSGRYLIMEKPGLYWVQATYGCDTVRDSINVELEYSPKGPVLPHDSIHCDVFPKSIGLDAKNDTIIATYRWHDNTSNRFAFVDKPGKYWVTVYTPNCGIMSDTVRFDLLKTPKVKLGNDTTYCDQINVTLDAKNENNDIVYSWNTLDSTQTIFVDTVGFYKVKVENYCGVDSAELNIDTVFTPQLVLPNDTTYCNAFLRTVHIGAENNMENYEWVDLSDMSVLGTADSLLVQQPLEVLVKLQNPCVELTDTLRIKKLYKPEINLPDDYTVCDVVNEKLFDADPNNEESYLWNGSNTMDTLIVNKAGKYVLEIENTCGSVKDSVEITLKNSPTMVGIEDSIFCNTVNITHDMEISDPDAKYKWSNGGVAGEGVITTTGKHFIEISNFCGTISDTFTYSIIKTPTVELGTERVFCGQVEGVDFDVTTMDNEEVYLWSNGAVTPATIISQEGKSWVRIENKCGIASDTVVLRVSEYPTVVLPEDTTLCGDFEVELDAGNAEFQHRWEPSGETSQTILANKQQVYTVYVTNDDGCTTSDQFEVRPDCISEWYIPNSFTPNGDGDNETFKPVLINYDKYHLQIFNRWGELMFETNDANQGWDGYYKNLPAMPGAYMYVLRIRFTEDGQYRTFHDQLYLVR